MNLFWVAMNQRCIDTATRETTLIDKKLNRQRGVTLKGKNLLYQQILSFKSSPTLRKPILHITRSPLWGKDPSPREGNTCIFC